MNTEIRKSLNGIEAKRRYNEIEDGLNQENCLNNKELRDKTSNFIKDIFSEEEPRPFVNIYKNEVLNCVLEQKSLNAKKEKIKAKLNDSDSIVDVYEISEDIILIEAYDSILKESYFRPVIGEKLINHAYDTKEKAIIGALTYKYNVNEFAYDAIMAMFNIREK